MFKTIAMKRYFVSGIGTGVGKTVVSAILTEKLQADYWKPIQSGDLDDSDTMKVKSLVTNPVSRFHSETYCLSQPMSPHAAAAIDNIEISLDKIQVPETHNHLIIEGAGGLMVPLNDQVLMIDLAVHFKAEIILVSMNYLGSINHTLLSVELLKSRNIPLAGIIFNGGYAKDTEEFIKRFTKSFYLGRINKVVEITPEFITQQTSQITLPV
jgi:dethiobiotin synthetase